MQLHYINTDGNLKPFKAELKWVFEDQKHSFTTFWNSDVLFVVVGANEFTTSQQTDIRNYFSKLKKYNCIVISQEHYVIDKENKSSLNINDVDTVTKLVVYTWFPYQSSDRCTDVNDITILDCWVISAQGHFTMNTDFFPGKISKSFNGCPT